MECFGDCNEFNIVVPLWSGRECPAQERTVLTTGLFTKLHSRLLEMQRKSLKDFKKACVPAILAFQKDQFVYGRQNRCLGCSFLLLPGGLHVYFPSLWASPEHWWFISIQFTVFLILPESMSLCPSRDRWCCLFRYLGSNLSGAVLQASRVFLLFYFLQYNLLIFYYSLPSILFCIGFLFPFFPHLLRVVTAAPISMLSQCPLSAFLSPPIPVSAISPLIPCLPLLKSLWCFVFLRELWLMQGATDNVVFGDWA